MAGGQPPARFAFKNRAELMNALHVGNQASDMINVLRTAGKKSPNDRTVTRICYSGQLMKSGTAYDMLRAFRQYANTAGVQIDDALFSPQNALVEFDTTIVGLDHEIQRASGGQLNADVDVVADIANHLNTTPEAVLQAVKGRCIQLPTEFANRLAVAASQVLRKAGPFEIVRSQPNERKIKPIGGDGVELGKPPHLCEETTRIRQSVLEALQRAA